ncbi:hypothetical protein [Nocardioides sp. LHG3406-4]|uniref:hypothetical protein n=1 Tax=Nocardioides sp. LHG3406-4 TaxID=2804575 RepID=UPI003CEFEFE2
MRGHGPATAGQGGTSGARRRVDERRPRRCGAGTVVVLAALTAVLGRFLGLLFPSGGDEAGFTLVARAWDPRPDSLYGPYWVDRPPPLIALFKLSDQLGGPFLIRAVAAAGCLMAVLAAAAAARAVLRHMGVSDEGRVARAGAWCAVLAAALTSSGMIDPVSAKGEILGIPLVLVSLWLSLTAVARPRPDAAALAIACGAGLTAAGALGAKQNLVAGLVFGAALLTGSVLDRRIGVGHGLRLAAAALVGAAVPVIATAGWAVASGVRLETLWYATYGFRADAAAAIALGGPGAPAARALLLVAVFVATGGGFVLLLMLVQARRILGRHRVLSVSAALVVGTDVVGLLLGGSFWRSYLFVFVPGLVLAAAMLLALDGGPARAMRRLVVVAAASTVVSLTVGAVLIRVGALVPGEVRTGEAIARASEPGDTIVSYGGRPSLVLASGLRSPYRHLWSLPMRTLDPGLKDLRALLAGPDAPTWLVLWVPTSAWHDTGRPLEPVVEQRYELHGLGCWDRPVYLLKAAERPALEPRCD